MRTLFLSRGRRAINYARRAVVPLVCLLCFAAMGAMIGWAV
jgi:hypothetical protein